MRDILTTYFDHKDTTTTDNTKGGRIAAAARNSDVLKHNYNIDSQGNALSVQPKIGVGGRARVVAKCSAIGAALSGAAASGTFVVQKSADGSTGWVTVISAPFSGIKAGDTIFEGWLPKDVVGFTRAQITGSNATVTANEYFDMYAGLEYVND